MLLADRYALHQHLPHVKISKSSLPPSIMPVVHIPHTVCYCEIISEHFLLVCPRDVLDQIPKTGPMR